MRKTPVLYAVHIGRLIKKRWHEQGKLKFEVTHAREVLEKNKIKLYTVEELDEKPVEKVRTNLLVPEELPLDKNHPDWKAEPCYIYGDNDVLVEGLNQARNITNALYIPQLPTSLTNAENNLNLPDEIHEEAQRRIKLSCIFDAYQELLPKRYLPSNPAFNLRREYGITDARKIKLLLNNLVQLCDQYSDSFEQTMSHDAFFSLPMTLSDKLVKLDLSAEVLLKSKQPLQEVEDYSKAEKEPIPNLHPLDSTISIKKYHFYMEEEAFPLLGSPYHNIHTIFFGHRKSEVKNLYDAEVTEQQILGRNLMKAFCAAGCQAKITYGKESVSFINPVVVQSVMTDGQYFHFAVFQLNSWNINSENAKKNLYWSSPLIPLYETCEYLNGVPTLTGYNPEVLKKIMTFYSNS